MMGFYQEISKYYDYIFPPGRAQIDFIREAAGEKGNMVLDVACGSGTYSIELARAGYKVTAVDYEKEMLAMAREKALKQQLSVDVVEGDMRELEGVLRNKFHCIFCIGNSIVHLGSIKEIGDVLGQMNRLLNPGGVLILQTINYDRVMKHSVSSLPSIINNKMGIEFIREYKYNRDRDTISFNTVLKVGNRGPYEEYKNSIELLPVKSSELCKAVEESGFGKVEMYGDFDNSSFNEDSYMTVIKAVNCTR